MIKKQKSKRSKSTQTQAYDIELLFRKFWTLVSKFSEIEWISYEFSMFNSFSEKKKRESTQDWHVAHSDWLARFWLLIGGIVVNDQRWLVNSQRWLGLTGRAQYGPSSRPVQPRHMSLNQAILRADWILTGLAHAARRRVQWNKVGAP